MVKAGLSTDPARRMGVYKRLADVPEKYRLEQRAREYKGRDVWTDEYLAELNEQGDLSEWYLKKAETAGRHWKDHMNKCGRHHALATPEDVETWCQSLMDGRKLRTVYERYWTGLEGFYTWLQFHTDHPHRYHPALMAASQFEAARAVWEFKISQRRDRDGRT